MRERRNPRDKKRKKKKKGPSVGTFTTASNMRIPVLQTEEKEKL